MSAQSLDILRSRVDFLHEADGKVSHATLTALSLLRDATYIADSAMGMGAMENASLLLYFQIIEGISQFVWNATPADHDDVDADRERIAARLRADIGQAAKPGHLSRLIHSADYELRQVESSHLRSRISRAGTELGLADEVVDDACLFLDARNKHLAHYGKSLAADERIVWFHQRKARSVAASFAGAFVDWACVRGGSG